ncbi:MAG: hypothetical protein Q9174_006616, partial [Haloplaca sp. 1 TL-2023]
PFKAPIFTILAGESGAVYHAHTSVLCQSSVLAKIVEGDWSETRDKKLVWKQWSVEGVEKLLAWLYTRDYHCSLPASLYEQEEVDSTSSQLSEGAKADLRLSSNSGDTERANRDDTVVSKMQTSRLNPPADVNDLGGKAEINDEDATLPSIGALNEPGCQKDVQISEAATFEVWSSEDGWTASEWQWDETLKTHAELYIMACQYELAGLKKMSWQRLRTIFNVFGSPERGSSIYDDVLTVVPYVYEETGPVDKEEDPLRMLFSTFAALNFTDIQGENLNELLFSAAHSAKEFIADLNYKAAIRMRSLAEPYFAMNHGKLDTKGRGKVAAKMPDMETNNSFGLWLLSGLCKA